MGKICLIKTSVNAMAQAQTLAAALVEQQKAACVQISGPGLSVYRWQGKVEQEQEYFLTVKTTPERCTEVVAWLSDHHPYETAEIIWREFDATDEYAAWLGSVVV